MRFIIRPMNVCNKLANYTRHVNLYLTFVRTSNLKYIEGRRSRLLRTPTYIRHSRSAARGSTSASLSSQDSATHLLLVVVVVVLVQPLARVEQHGARHDALADVVPHLEVRR